MSVQIYVCPSKRVIVKAGIVLSTLSVRVLAIFKQVGRLLVVETCRETSLDDYG